MMPTALLIVFGLGVLVYVFFGFLRRDKKGSKPAATTQKNCQDNDACGVSCFCDDKALKLKLGEEIIYFDDEELDQYKGFGADAYTEFQTEQFYEVLTTLQPQEVGQWLHSLELRGIRLPDSLREEAQIMME